MIRLQSSDPAIAREPGLYTGAASAATINNQDHGLESTTIEREDFFIAGREEGDACSSTNDEDVTWTTLLHVFGEAASLAGTVDMTATLTTRSQKAWTTMEPCPSSTSEGSWTICTKKKGGETGKN